jgi:hypothetical protein
VSGNIPRVGLTNDFDDDLRGVTQITERYSIGSEQPLKGSTTPPDLLVPVIPPETFQKLSTKVEEVGPRATSRKHAKLVDRYLDMGESVPKTSAAVVRNRRAVLKVGNENPEVMGKLKLVAREEGALSEGAIAVWNAAKKNVGCAREDDDGHGPQDCRGSSKTTAEAIIS